MPVIAKKKTARRKKHARFYREEKFTRRRGITWREDGWPLMQSVIKPCKADTCHVDHFTISKLDAESYNLRALMSFSGGMQVDPGKYVRLVCGGEVMMSDTRMERRTNWEIKKEAHGRVLIAGLGIGMILHPLLDPARHTFQMGGCFSGAPTYPVVDHVTVVELNEDVIKLVGPTLKRYGDRVSIVQGDINEFDPGKEKFDTVYFDIWPSIDEENLPEIARLHQRWKTKLNRSGERKPFMSSWEVEHLRARRREDQRGGWGW